MGIAVVASVISIGAARKGVQTQRLTIELATGWYKHNEAARPGWKEHFGLDTDEGVRVRANLVLKPTNEANVQAVTGDVQVLTPGGGSFPVVLDRHETLELKKLRDGRAIFDGTLFGKIRNAQGRDADVVMSLTFLPGTNQGVMAFAVSGGSQSTRFVFGQSFITAEEGRWLWNHKGED